MTEEGKKSLTFGERALNLSKAAGALAVATGVLIGYLKSDDAQQDVAGLLKQLDERVAKQEKVINAQSEKLEKMARRMLFFQGHQAGISAGKLLVKVEQTEKRLDQCYAKRIPKTTSHSDLVKVLQGIRKGKPSASPTQPFIRQKTIPKLHSRPFRKGK